jgi:DNA-binding LacI/PurR family transcriptional regulator
MNVSKQQIGAMAAQLLIRRISHSEGAPTLKVSIGGKLVVRKSVQRLPQAP